MRRLLIAFSAGLPLLVLAATVRAQDGATLYTDNCAPCHTIGEAGGVGPDLRGIATRRQRDWLLAFVLDPPSVNKDAAMPAPQGLDRESIAAILDYIDSRSAAPAPAAAPATPVVEFTADDVSRGRALFAGSARLENGGPACMVCHGAGLAGTVPGGTLGPDLSRVTSRLSGPKGTATWLSAPPTPVMRSLFGHAPLAPAEVHALTALLVDRASIDAGMPPALSCRFVTFAVAGAAGAFVLIGLGWRRRLGHVRRTIVSGGERPRVPATHTHGFRSGGPR